MILLGHGRKLSGSLHQLLARLRSVLSAPARLASDVAKNVTGQTLGVGGGWTTGSPATGKVILAFYHVSALLKPVSSYPFSDGELLL